MVRHGLAFLCFALLMTMVACGGAGSDETVLSSDDGAITRESGTGVRLTGVATKGTLKSAAVTIYELDDKGARTGTVVGATETDNSGVFALNVERRFRGSVVEVEVAAISGRTVMTCDARRCDDEIRFDDVTLTSALALSTIVKIPLEANALDVSVTAWSAMAAKRAKALNNIDAIPLDLALRQANSEVSQIVGFNLAQTQSRGLGDLDAASETEAQYAVVNAAAAEILFRNGGLGELNEELSDFTNALAGDGTIGSDDDSFTLAQLSDAIRRVTNSISELGDATGDALANQTALFDLAGKKGFSPGYDDSLALGVDATQAEKIAAFRAFISQVRTWLSALENLNSLQLREVAPVDVDTVEAILNRETQSRFQYLGEVIDQSVAFVVSNPQRVRLRILENQPETIDIVDKHGDPMGNATLSFVDADLPDGFQMQAVGFVTDSITKLALPFKLSVTTGVPADTLLSATDDQETAVRDLAQVLVSSNLSLSGFIEDGHGNPALILDDVSLRNTLDPVLLAKVTGGVDIANLFKSTSLIGKIRIINKRARFSGEIQQDLVRLGAGAGDPLDTQTGPMFSEMLHLYGEFSSADGEQSFSTSVTARAKSNSAFDTFSWLEYGNGARYVSGTLDNPDRLFDLAEGDLDETLLPSFTLQANFDPAVSQQNRIRFLGYAKADVPLLEDYLHCLNEARKQNEVEDISDAVRLEGMCADFNLELVQSERLLSAEIVNALEQEVKQDLLERFDLDSDQQLILSDFYAYGDATGTVNSYTVAMVFRDAEVANDFRDVSLTVASRIDVPELRSAQAAATIRSTSHSGGHVRTDVAWNGGSYTIDFDIDDITKPASVSVRLSNTQGYELDFTVQDVNGKLSVSGYAWMSGEMIGRIELRNDMPLIIYPDGNKDIIESIF